MSDWSESCRWPSRILCLPATESTAGSTRSSTRNDSRSNQAGYQKLKQQVEQAGAKLIVITPPFYDDQRKPAGMFSYNEVLDQYAAWLVPSRPRDGKSSTCIPR